jgi:RNA polymerase sigma-70 factor (ECF subfamily)
VPTHSVDDAVQDTLLTLHQARQTYDPSRSFIAWLRVIAQRRAIDVMRRAIRTEAREVHAPLAYDNHSDFRSSPEAAALEKDHTAVLEAAIGGLPQRQRVTVEYMALEGHSLARAAVLTGRTAGSLRVSWHRAIRALRAGLSGKD